MNLEVGQLFVFGFYGLHLPKEALTLLSEHHASGTILFRRNIESLKQVVELNTQIVQSQQNTIFDALISVDQEGGRVARLSEICTPIPPMRRLAEMAHSNPQFVYQVAAMMGRELSALGFHLDFAPIADIDSNPQNPIIGDRSFGNNKDTVAQMCSQFIKGLQASGVAACAKHFPGHGDTSQDSHLELPMLPHTLNFLKTRELHPFQEAIHAGVATIMTAHVLLPQIDDFPATLSHKILSTLLREEMGFDGLIVSDDLEMKGVADHYSLRDMLYRGIMAGVDLFLICSDTNLAMEAIQETKRLVHKGEIPAERLAQSIDKVARFKQKYLGAVSAPSLEYAKHIVRCKPHTQLLKDFS